LSREDKTAQALHRVSALASDLDDTKRDLVEAMFDARASGATLRMLADAARVSHEQVRLVLRART
jgi:hypothetical protein